MLELPWQSIEEGAWGLKEVEMLETMCDVGLQDPLPDYVSLKAQRILSPLKQKGAERSPVASSRAHRRLSSVGGVDGLVLSRLEMLPRN